MPQKQTFRLEQTIFYYNDMKTSKKVLLYKIQTTIPKHFQITCQKYTVGLSSQDQNKIKFYYRGLPWLDLFAREMVRVVSVQ